MGRRRTPITGAFTSTLAQTLPSESTAHRAIASQALSCPAVPKQILLSRLSYETSHSAVKVFELAVQQNLTVADIYNILVQNGRHKYEFDANGVGCRCWTSGQLDLLKEKQVLTNPQEVATVKDAILKLWPEGTPMALDQGAYYQ